MRFLSVLATVQYQPDFVQGFGRGESAEFVRAPVHMEGAQASFQILRLSATTSTALNLRTVRPNIAKGPVAEFEQHVEWALGLVVAGPGSKAAGLASPDEVRVHHSARLPVANTTWRGCHSASASSHSRGKLWPYHQL